MAAADPRPLRLLPLACVLALLLFTGLGFDPTPQLFARQDKVQHLLGFLVLAWALRYAFPRLRFGYLMLVGLALAGLIELGQVLLPRRTPSLGDMVANLAGLLLGWGCAQVMQAWSKVRSAEGIEAPVTGRVSGEP